MRTSESTKNIFAAILKFQGSVTKIKKSSNNPFFKSKYAPLPDILDAISQPLQEAGLAFMQHPENDHELTTIVVHADSGEWIESTYKMVPVKNTPQDLGSAITYQRRYALGAIFGLNIDEDDDGNKASGKPEPLKGELQSNGNPKRTMTQAQYDVVLARIKAGEEGVFDKVLATYEVTPKQKIELSSALTQAKLQ